jgi:hypothetical protein
MSKLSDDEVLSMRRSKDFISQVLNNGQWLKESSCKCKRRKVIPLWKYTRTQGKTGGPKKRVSDDTMKTISDDFLKSQDNHGTSLFHFWKDLPFDNCQLQREQFRTRMLSQVNDIPRQKVPTTLSESRMNERVQFAKSFEGKSIDNFLFSDEVCINKNEVVRMTKVYGRKGEMAFVSKDKRYGECVMFSVVVHSSQLIQVVPFVRRQKEKGSRERHFITKDTVTSKKYLSRVLRPLESAVIKSGLSFVFIDDNASSHCSLLTRTWWSRRVDTQLSKYRMRLPPTSPDLNPCEKVINLIELLYLKEKNNVITQEELMIYKTRYNVDRNNVKLEIIIHVERVVKSINESIRHRRTIRLCYDSFLKVCGEVVTANGQWTKTAHTHYYRRRQKTDKVQPEECSQRHSLPIIGDLIDICCIPVASCDLTDSELDQVDTLVIDTNQLSIAVDVESTIVPVLTPSCRKRRLSEVESDEISSTEFQTDYETEQSMCDSDIVYESDTNNDTTSNCLNEFEAKKKVPVSHIKVQRSDMSDESIVCFGLKRFRHT